MGNITAQKVKKFYQMGALSRGFPEALTEASSPSLFVWAAARWGFHFINVRRGRKGRIAPVIADVGREWRPWGGGFPWQHSSERHFLRWPQLPRRSHWPAGDQGSNRWEVTTLPEDMDGVSVWVTHEGPPPPGTLSCSVPAPKCLGLNWLTRGEVGVIFSSLSQWLSNAVCSSSI